MNHNRKDVFTVRLDADKGETPELMMTAIAMAIFDLAPPLHDPDDASVTPDLRYAKDDVLTQEEAERHVISASREICMMFPKGRMCVAHVFASRLAPTECEIVMAMYDRDGDKLLDRASERLGELVAARDLAFDVDFLDPEDITLDLEDVLDEEPTLRIPLPASA